MNDVTASASKVEKIFSTNKNLFSAVLDLNNGEEVVTGSSEGRFTGLNLGRHVYLGGCPFETDVQRRSGFSQGFTGCVSHLSIDGIDVNFSKEKIDIKGDVRDCEEACTVNPCLHGGKKIRQN